MEGCWVFFVFFFCLGGPQRGETENIGALDDCRVSHFVSEGADVSPSP